MVSIDCSRTARPARPRALHRAEKEVERTIVGVGLHVEGKRRIDRVAVLVGDEANDGRIAAAAARCVEIREMQALPRLVELRNFFGGEGRAAHHHVAHLAVVEVRARHRADHDVLPGIGDAQLAQGFDRDADALDGVVSGVKRARMKPRMPSSFTRRDSL